MQRPPTQAREDVRTGVDRGVLTIGGLLLHLPSTTRPGLPGPTRRSDIPTLGGGGLHGDVMKGDNWVMQMKT